MSIRPIMIGAFGTITKGTIKGTGRLGGWRTGGDQNTEKSPGDLRRLAVTQTPLKNHRLKLM